MLMIPAAEPAAAEWLADCRAYLAALDGAEASDLDITYCTGQTVGILAGLGTGARIGAVSMASTLTVLAGLDEEEVLAVFRDMEQSRLLGYCLPDDVPLAEVISAVAGHLSTVEGRAELPVTAAFFEALQAGWPCVQDPPPASGSE
jgi:hypothetical protein